MPGRQDQRACEARDHGPHEPGNGHPRREHCGAPRGPSPGRFRPARRRRGPRPAWHHRRWRARCVHPPRCERARHGPYGPSPGRDLHCPAEVTGGSDLRKEQPTHRPAVVPPGAARTGRQPMTSQPLESGPPAESRRLRHQRLTQQMPHQDEGNQHPQPRVEHREIPVEDGRCHLAPDTRPEPRATTSTTIVNSRMLPVCCRMRPSTAATARPGARERPARGCGQPVADGPGQPTGQQHGQGPVSRGREPKVIERARHDQPDPQDGRREGRHAHDGHRRRLKHPFDHTMWPEAGRDAQKQRCGQCEQQCHGCIPQGGSQGGRDQLAHGLTSSKRQAIAWHPPGQALHAGARAAGRRRPGQVRSESAAQYRSCAWHPSSMALPGLCTRALYVRRTRREKGWDPQVPTSYTRHRKASLRPTQTAASPTARLMPTWPRPAASGRHQEGAPCRQTRWRTW